jgi:phosphoglycerate-specific signal transduction histidine kinase
MAADLFCFYRTRPTHTRLAENIQAQSRSLLGGQPETDCAKLLRCVRWQQESLQHGLEQLAVDEAVAAQRKWLAATQAGPNGDKDYAVAAREIVDGHSDPLDFVLHRPVVNETKQESDSTPVPDTERTDNSFQTASSSSDLPEGDLVSHLRNRAAELASLARELQVQQDHLEERMLGTLAIADSMDIRTLHASMTPTQLVGMLVLGVSIWIGTVLLYWNWARGSSTHPQRAIAWLERLGIPLRGSISTWNPVEVAQGSASSESRYARVLHRIGEGLLAVLILAIALRIVSDPEWRHLLATDPLAGLGHLVRS